MKNSRSSFELLKSSNDMIKVVLGLKVKVRNLVIIPIYKPPSAMLEEYSEH